MKEDLKRTKKNIKLYEKLQFDNQTNFDSEALKKVAEYVNRISNTQIKEIEVINKSEYESRRKRKIPEITQQEIKEENKTDFMEELFNEVRKYRKK